MKLELNRQKRRNIHSFETKMGSVYTTLPDLTFQRFKTVEGKLKSPYPLAVFILEHDVLKEKGKDYQHIGRIVGADADETSDNIEDLIYHCKRSTAICDSQGNIVKTVDDLLQHDIVYICLTRKGADTLHIPAYTEVKVGCHVYELSDTRHHMGNKVVKINPR